MNWCDIPGALDGFENNPAFLEKLAIDDDTEMLKKETLSKKNMAVCDTCSWIRKRRYQKKMIRQFLSINPDMDYSKFFGTRCRPAIYCCFPTYQEDGFFDPRMYYDFNHYTKVFLSPRGDLRKYHGDIFPIRSSYALGPKDRDAAIITNRRIRHQIIDEESINCYSYLKKHYGALIDEIW